MGDEPFGLTELENSEIERNFEGLGWGAGDHVGRWGMGSFEYVSLKCQ